MNKFLKLLLILAITPVILATAGFVILPSSVFAYIRDGKEVFIGSYMLYTFALINAVLSFFGITYLRRVRKKFNDENYPTGVTVVAFVNLLISIMCNYFTFSVLKLMLKNSKMEIPFYLIRLVVFIAGGIFILIVSWIIGNQNQLYITTLFTLIICAISSNYISRTIGMKYKMMYKEKDKEI